MKLVRVVFGLATLSLAVAGTACGPEERYCFKEHKTCAQAMADKMNAEEEARQREEEARRDSGVGGLGDSAIVLESGTGTPDPVDSATVD